MRLIDAETFPNKLKEMMIQIDKNRGEPEEDWFLNGFDEFVIALDVIDLVKEMPTVDAMPVVRCCNCKYLQWNMRQDGSLPFGVDEYECRHWCGGCDPTDFCSYGERRKDADSN